MDETMPETIDREAMIARLTIAAVLRYEPGPMRDAMWEAVRAGIVSTRPVVHPVSGLSVELLVAGVAVAVVDLDVLGYSEVERAAVAERLAEGVDAPDDASEIDPES
jgi:hypothetical protein